MGRLVVLRRVAHVCYFFCVIIGLISGGFLVAGLSRKYGGSYAAPNLGCLLGVEILSIVTGLMGTIGISKSAHKVIKLSVGLLVVCLLLTVGVVTFSKLKLDDIIDEVHDDLQVLMLHYEHYVHTVTDYKGDVILNNIQRRYQCCGNTSPLNWKNVEFGKMPPSCCRVSFATECMRIQNQSISFEMAYKALSRIHSPVVGFYNRGCLDAMTFWYIEAWKLITACAGANGIFLFFTLFITIGYCSVIDKLGV